MRLELIAEGIDVSPLVRLLENKPYLWDLETARQDYPGSAHHDTKCLIFRGPREFTMESWMGSHIAEWSLVTSGPSHAALSEVTRPVHDILNTKEVGYIMAVSLKAGGHVDLHIDEGVYAEYYDRYHLVLKSEEGNRFYNEDESVWMQEGELWRFDHRSVHYVENNSASDRWHLIIDATT